MFRSILPIAKNTFTDLVRQKVFYFLLVFAVVTIALSFGMAQFRFDAQFQMMKDICLGAMSIFTSLLAILATATFLPRDLEERMIYTLLSKPVPRISYLLGKLLGIIFLLFIFTLLMSAVFCVMLWLRQEAVLSDIHSQGGPAEEVQAAVQSVLKDTFNFNLVPGILIIFVKGALLASMTLLISTFATSFIFTVLISFAVYLIGHLQSTAREYMLQGVDVQWWTHILVGAVALIFPDLQAFNLSDDVIAGVAIPSGIFLQTFGLGWMYVAVYFAVAAFVFSGREL